MDERWLQELSEWLEFYRELGIEEFYLGRAPAETEAAADEAIHESPRRAAETAAGQEEAVHVPLLVRSESDQRTPRIGESPAGTAETVAGQEGATHEPHPPTPCAAPAVVAGPAAQPLSLFEAPPPPRREKETLEDIRHDLGDCHRCRLAEGRKSIVYGEGNPRAELVFVGEGPGADEDEQGLPFVGRAGKLLDRMIQHIGMKRQDVYICNVVKCRPPGNRTPLPDEIETCSPYLFRQIQAIRPRLVCCLGAPAVRTVLGVKEGITKIRGRFYDFAGSKALATVHPAYILRNPREEKILREDFEKIREFLASPRA